MATNYQKDKVTFINVQDLALSEIREIFSEFGDIVDIREHKKRIFVRYNNELSAENALKSPELKQLDMKWAHKRPRNSESLNSIKASKYRDHDIFRDEIKIDSSSTSSQFSSGNSENLNSTTESFRRNRSLTKKDVSELPSLIESKDIPVLHSVILGSLPDEYTLEDVHKLVKEVHPLGFSKLELTRSSKLKFCEVFLRSENDVLYLLGKLDNFIISGKKLIAVEPSVLLSRKIYNA